MKLDRRGIGRGFFEAQWNGRFETEKYSGILAPHGPKYERIFTSRHVGVPVVKQIAFRYQTDELFRVRPYLELRDLDGAKFVLLLNQSLFEKLETIRVFANEYLADPVVIASVLVRREVLECENSIQFRTVGVDKRAIINSAVDVYGDHQELWG